jgi:hypothetical protein
MEIGIVTKVLLLALAVVSVISLVLALIAFFPHVAYGIMGLWLFLYRACLMSSWLETRYWPFAQVFANMMIGAGSLLFFLPLLPWPASELIRSPILVVVGTLMSNIQLLALVTSSCCIGAFVGGLLWHCGILHMVPGGLLSLDASCIVLILVVFLFTPKKNSPFVPILGALFIVESLAPACGLLPQEILLKEAATPASTTYVAQAVRTLLAWLGATVCGVLLLIALPKPPDSGREEDLLQSFLPVNKEADEEGGLGYGSPKKGDGLERLPALGKAICAEDPDTINWSELSEHEQEIVKIAREDAEQKNRILHGGGLW